LSQARARRPAVGARLARTLGRTTKPSRRSPCEVQAQSIRRGGSCPLLAGHRVPCSNTARGVAAHEFHAQVASLDQPRDKHISSFAWSSVLASGRCAPGSAIGACPGNEQSQEVQPRPVVLALSTRWPIRRLVARGSIRSAPRRSGGHSFAGLGGSLYVAPIQA
jgi:hypothetical protein